MGWSRHAVAVALAVCISASFVLGAGGINALNRESGAGPALSAGGTSPGFDLTPSELRAAPTVVAPYSEPGIGLPGAMYLGAPVLRTPADPTGTIDLLLTLSFTNESRLNELLAALSNSSSPEYHQYLTATEFNAQFGASAPVYNSMVEYLSSYGVTQLTTHSDRLAISFAATPAQVTSIFHTTLGAYVSGTDQPFYAPRSPPLLPAPLHPFVVDVEGLSNYSEYLNHLAPLASLPAALAGDAATGGAIPAISPLVRPDSSISPGQTGNPFGSTSVTSNGLTNTYDRPVVLNLKGKSGTCDTNDCGSLLQAPNLQVAYNETGVFQKYGYPVNATVAAVLWTDPICHANIGTCGSSGLFNYFCSTITQSAASAWDFFMPDVTSFWKYSLPAGEPMPRAVSLPITGYTYAYPAGSQGYSASCDDGEAEGENTLDVDMLGAMAPGANVFQVFGGSASTTAIDTVLADILSPTTGAFSSTGGFDTAANVKDLTNVSVITNSWTTSGALPAAFTTDLKAAQARGITVLGASGDGGTAIAPPAELGGNTFGTVAVGGTTVALNTTTLLRGPPHLASAAAPYYGVGRGEIGWYEPAGKVDGFSSTYGGTGGVATSTTYYRATWFNASADAQSVANAVRSGNYRAEPDLSAIANDTIIDLEAGPYSLNFTCWVSSSCAAVSSIAVGTSHGSAPIVGATYFVGTSIADQIAGGEIATVDHALFTQHEGWVGYLNPAIYPQGQKQFGGSLTLPSFYDVTTYTDAGGLAAAYEAKPGYDLATGWGVLDAGNFTRNTLTYAATFTESGLPASTPWSVTLTPAPGDAGCAVSGSVCSNPTTLSSSASTIVFHEPFGTYNFRVGGPSGYHPAPGSGTVKVNGAPIGQSITFSPVSYSVTFTESGLPTSTIWSVTLAGTLLSSSTSTIAFAEPNGTYGYGLGAVPGYRSTPSSGSVTVAGAAIPVGVSFSAAGFTVSFAENGLPAGRSFGVTLNGVAESLTTNGGTDTLTFGEPNGTYLYSIANVAGWTQSTLPPSGTITVTGAAVAEPTLEYLPVEYSVAFQETGLPTGSSWSVTLGGSLQSTVGTTISFSAPNGTESYSVTPVAGFHATPHSGTVTIAGASILVGISFGPATYSVGFSESGLPSGQTFEVTVGGSAQSRTTDGATDGLTFVLTNGTYAYSIGPIAGWHQSTLPYSGSVTVAGSPVTQPTLAFAAFTYPVTFSETGLPGGTPWSVMLGGTTLGSSTPSIAFSEPNGSISYTVGAVAGYSPAPSSGSVTVSGSSNSISIRFTQVAYSVGFSESGLPSGTLFGVTLNGVPKTVTTDGGTDPIGFTEPNGTFAYTIGGVPGWHQSTLPYHGSVLVNGAAVLEPTLVFTPVVYTVSFAQSGLPSGTTWTVTLNGAARSTTGATVGFSEPNGSFSYSIADVPGWHQSTLPYHGSVTVNGATVTEPTLVFGGVTYPVSFTESGLPSGTLWSVTLQGALSSSTAGSISFSEPNGTYTYSIGGVPGYHAAVRSGSVGVAGSGITVTVIFTQTAYSVEFSESGLLPGLTFSVTLAGTTRSLTTDGGTDVLILTEPNGSFAYSIGRLTGWHQATLPYSGSVTVSGAPVNEPTLLFSAVVFEVAFSERGLPAGSSWSVTLGGVTQGSIHSSIFFNATNGTYAYSVGSVSGYSVVPASGSVTVAGASQVVSVVYSQGSYVVTFKETGIALAGTTGHLAATWSVKVGSTTVSGNTPTLVFDLPNGSYSYTLGAVAGYVASHPSGTFLVVGGPVTVSVTFSPSILLQPVGLGPTASATSPALAPRGESPIAAGVPIARSSA